jgi:hypothetical protein
MEDTKLKRIRMLPSKRRRGVALVTVLLIAMFGAIIVASIFEISTRFGRENTVFRETYSDQVITTGFVEQVKGRISAWVADNDLALHANTNLANPNDSATLSEWENGIEVTSLDDLRVMLMDSGNDVLNFDTIVAGRRVEVRTYDLTYRSANIATSMSEEDIALLPAPLELASVIEGGASTGVDPESETDEIGSGPGSSGTTLALRFVGAYLVRVQIFHTDGRLVEMSGRLARTTEESFFILARNAGGTAPGGAGG